MNSLVRVELVIEAATYRCILDLATRSGLKKVHANFEAIYRRLDKAYEKHASNEKITGGIAGIYAKMSADVLLRNKLFDKGVSPANLVDFL